MRVIVLMRQLADLVEELEVNSEGTDIDRDFVKFVSNEWDEAALELGLELKDDHGVELTVAALEEPDVDQTLYAALAKGADRAVKLTGLDPDTWIRSRQRATAMSKWLAGVDYDLVLTGVQAADDLDGQLAGLLAAHLGVPHAAVVVGLEPGEGTVTVTQELGGGVLATSELSLPAVIGVQTAKQAPRYVPITRIRQAMAQSQIEEAALGELESEPMVTVRRLFSPEAKGSAEMLTGSPKEVAAAIIELVRSRGLL
jgi:electron transfer flavoprotein beta subunit